METLEQALAEVNRVSDKMVGHLTWCNRERAKKIQALADSGHTESKLLIAHFRLWHIAKQLNKAGFVESSESMIAHFDNYRAANYIE